MKLRKGVAAPVGCPAALEGGLHLRDARLPVDNVAAAILRELGNGLTRVESNNNPEHPVASEAR